MKFEMLLFITLAVLIKLIPEFPHANPELVFSLYFLSYYPRLTASVAILVMWLLGDLSYALLYHTSIFGSWSLFNYSALLLLLCPRFLRRGDLRSPVGISTEPLLWATADRPYGNINHRLRPNSNKKPMLHLLWVSISVTLIFWLWSNLGVWLTSGMYPHTMAGFIHCYVLALPFLYDAALAASGWSSLLILLSSGAIYRACGSKNEPYLAK